MISQQDHEVSFISGIKCPINTKRIKEESAKDPTQLLLKNTIFRGWPNHRKQCLFELHDYWNFRCDLVLDDGIMLKGNRILIPELLRDDVPKAIHTAHQGEVKSILLAREFVFWPVMTKDIKEMVKECSKCSQNQPAPAKYRFSNLYSPQGHGKSSALTFSNTKINDTS